MSTLSLYSAPAAEPMPNVTQQVDVTPDFGSYGVPWEMRLLAPTGNSVRLEWATYATGQDYNVHYSESKGWISAPLAAQTLNGAWSADLSMNVNSVGVGFISARAWAALFRWGADDTKKEQIGAAIRHASELSTTITSYNFVFSASKSVTFARGDRLYLENWAEVRDSLDEDGFVQIYRIYRGGSTFPSTITTPGTVLLAKPKSTRIALCGVGV